MDGELELSEQITNQSGTAPGKRRLGSAVRSGVGKKTRRLQAWHYLIVICAAFWALFATILILSGFTFLIVALIVIVLLSILVIALAWAFQNNI